MSQDEEIQRLANLVDKCFEKLANYNYAYHKRQKNRRYTVTDLSFSTIRTESINSISNSPSTPTTLKSSSHSSLSGNFHFDPHSRHPKGDESHEISEKSRGEERGGGEERGVGEKSVKTQLLRRRYTHHFSTLEAFLLAYIHKLEERYKDNKVFIIPSPSQHTLTTQIVMNFDAYSYTVLKLDGFYWSANGLKDHEFVKNGGKWFFEGIEKIQEMALNYLKRYETVMRGAPKGAMRVVLVPLDKRRKLQVMKGKKEKKKKMWKFPRIFG